VESGSREENAPIYEFERILTQNRGPLLLNALRSGRVLGEDGWPDKALGCEIPASRGWALMAGKGWDRQTRKKPAVPCRLIEIAGRKCGFAGQPGATA